LLRVVVDFVNATGAANRTQQAASPPERWQATALQIALCRFRRCPEEGHGDQLGAAERVGKRNPISGVAEDITYAYKLDRDAIP
jgi:hypothetical protein